MRVVVLAPHRFGDPRRDLIWEWVKGWYDRNIKWPVYYGESPYGVFSIAKARNRVARMVDWDVALMIDSDTIADPTGIEEAVERASKHNQMFMAGDTHMRMSERTSNRIMFENKWYPRPDGVLPKNGVNENCYGYPSSGCFAIGRELWEATGGFVECMQGWGYEDITFMTQTHVVGDGVAWVEDSTLLHFWHPRADHDEDTLRNSHISHCLHELCGFDKEMAKDFLRKLGHQW